MRKLFLLLSVVACGGADATPLIDGGADTGTPGDGSADGNMCATQEICGDGKDNDCNGMTDENCKGLGTWVSGATGNDMDPGTQQKPVKTIKQGIQNAITIGGKQTVFVAGSHYPEKVTMVEGISLDGGYQCDMMACTWTRSPGMYDTALLAPDFEGVLAPATITRATKISGFRLQGMNGTPTMPPGSAAITVIGNPTITENRINGGDVNGGAQYNMRRSIGVAILAPNADPNGALVENNDIQGGGSIDTSWGILIDYVPMPPMGATTAHTIKGNRIKGGTAPNTYGIGAWSSGGTASITGNAITAGTSNAMGGPGTAWGMLVFGTLLVDSNMINTDQNTVGVCPNPGNWCGGLVSISSTSTITNNVIYGIKAPRSAAVELIEGEKPAGVVILNSNLMDGAGTQTSINTTTSAALAIHINSGNNAILGRVRNNVMLGGININRFGLIEDPVPTKTNKPQFFENNQIFFAPMMGRFDVAWRQWNGSMNTDVQMPPMNTVGDPMVDATWHLIANSPCIDKGTMTEAPAKDRDGQARPSGMGFDIGPDEK